MSRSHNPPAGAHRAVPRPAEHGDPGAGREALERTRPRDADLGDRQLRSRPQPRPARPGEREQPLHLGFNPAADADATLVVGRVTADADGKVIGRSSISLHRRRSRGTTRHLPRYIGRCGGVEGKRAAPRASSLRRLGRARPGAPVLGDPAVADQHGRGWVQRTGDARGMLPAGQALRTTARSSRAHRSRLAAGAVRAVDDARRRSRRGAVARQAPATARGARGRARGREPQTDQGAPLSARSRSSATSAVVTTSVAGVGLEGWRQPPRRACERGVSCFQEDLALRPRCTVVVMNTSGAEVGYLYPPELDGLATLQCGRPRSRRTRCRRDRRLHRRGPAPLRERLTAGSAHDAAAPCPVGAVPSCTRAHTATQKPTTPSGTRHGSA